MVKLFENYAISHSLTMEFSFFFFFGGGGGGGGAGLYLVI